MNASIVWVVVGGVALGGLFIYYAFVVGEPVPIWQALLVAAVNIVGAAKLFANTLRAKREREAARRPSGVNPAQK